MRLLARFVSVFGFLFHFNVAVNPELNAPLPKVANLLQTEYKYLLLQWKLRWVLLSGSEGAVVSEEFNYLSGGRYHR
jgi:hypothetical protein